MTSAFKIITPEQHVAQEVGKLLVQHYSFLEEQRRKLAALDDSDSENNENQSTPNNGQSTPKGPSK